MSERGKVHGELSSLLANLTETQVVELLQPVAWRAGWGATGVVSVGGTPVFVKLLPVTNLELDHQGSTRNLFNLPVTYNYGVGSAGFGSARELAAHLKTTRWVLEGALPSFPLLYHHRYLAIPTPARQRDPGQLDRYVASWDGNESIRRFITERQRSTLSLALFSEVIPHVLMDWVPAHQDRIDWVIEEATEITRFLRTNDVAHFDANPSNILTDGNTLFFADFGLFLDAEFDLVPAERRFLAEHTYWDFAEFICSLSWPFPNQTIDYGEPYRRSLSRYEALTAEMSGVFQRLHQGPKNSGSYNDQLAKELLGC
jgi:hypothetical protein